VPGNFLAIFTTQFLTRLADALASSKIVLPWLITSVGAPAFLSGMLVPIRVSGSLLPQLIIGGFIRRHPVGAQMALRYGFGVAGIEHMRHGLA